MLDGKPCDCHHRKPDYTFTCQLAITGDHPCFLMICNLCLTFHNNIEKGSWSNGTILPKSARESTPVCFVGVSITWAGMVIRTRSSQESRSSYCFQRWDDRVEDLIERTSLAELWSTGTLCNMCTTRSGVPMFGFTSTVPQHQLHHTDG